MGVSVSTLREEFRKHIKPFVSDIPKYGTHSMKSGAASNPSCRKIAGDLLDIFMLVGGVNPLSTDILSMVLANV